MKIDKNVLALGVLLGLAVCWMNKEKYGCGGGKEQYSSGCCGR